MTADHASAATPLAHLTGRLHSYETLGTLDGPGLRLVVFLQGCPLRCLYCHNPDTWDVTAGRQVTVEEIVAKALRMRPYFGAAGGVTLSGGEPLAQPFFTLALLQALKKAAIHTVLDTSGIAAFSAADRLNEADQRLITQILAATDLVLLDIKAPTATQFQALTGCSITGLETFLALANARQQAVWIRQVIVPGLNDTAEDLATLGQFLQRYPDLNIEKVELLPYHTLGTRKYEQLGIAYPLANLSPLPAAQLTQLQQQMDAWLANRHPAIG